jgi:CBS domain-containing protein
MGIRENIKSETVAELPLREAITVPPTMTVREAIDRMRGKRLGCVVVVNDDGKPQGTFTEEEIVKMLSEGLDGMVGEHISPSWASVKISAPIASVLELMQTKNLRFVVVTDEDGKAIALTGQKGLMEYVAEHFPQQVMVQRVGVKPYSSQREGA